MTLKPFVFALLWAPALLISVAPSTALAGEDDFLRTASMMDRGWKPSAKSLDAARRIRSDPGRRPR